jgi:pyruvate-formate lyase
MELSERLIRIKNRLYNKEFREIKPWQFINASIFEYKGMENEPLVVRKAIAYEYIGRNLAAYIKDDELVVGNPDYNSTNYGHIIPKYATDEELAEAAKVMLDPSSIWGHYPPDWQKVIKDGLNSIKHEINIRIEEEISKEKPDTDTLNELRAMLISLDAVITFAKRHAQIALKESVKETDPARKQELYELYKICSKVPENPPETYQEALQGFWFSYCILNSGGNHIPLARMDQYLYPYFKKDIEEGRITREYAIDLTGSFLAKFNERVLLDPKPVDNHFTFGTFSSGIPEKYQDQVSFTNFAPGIEKEWNPNEDEDSEGNNSFGQSGNHWFMNFILGGQNEDGDDATNDLSFLIIDLMNAMDLLMPILSVRIHDNTPPRFIEKTAEMLRSGKGEPVIYNDNAVIPGLLEMGINKKDALDYSNDGCWEVVIPGKSYDTYSVVEGLKCLEWVLNRGYTLSREKQDGLDTGEPEDFKTWDEFYDAYLKQMHKYFDFVMNLRLDNFGMTGMIAPEPLMSAFVDDCISKGRDITQGGARYYFHLFVFAGLANTVDSLAVIKKLVFMEKSVSMKQIVSAVKNNWEDECLRQRAMNTVPKYGNDNDFTDEISVRLLHDFEERMLYWRERQDTFKLYCAVGTFENYGRMGRPLAASPDGRRAGEALAPNYSPYYGKDKEGPTAVFKSATKPELLRFFGGCPVDISINKNEVEGNAGIERLVGLIKTFNALGGIILTIGVNSADDLKKAKKDPEKYKNLRVRLGGFSNYFVALAPEEQDNIIKRFDRD